jgi:Zn-dependent M28 family amino/carboxypeptidase
VLRATTAASAVLLALATAPAAAQDPVPASGPGSENPRIHEIVRAVQPARIERDVRALAGFGTRHTLSDTVSPTRGIGAARRWIFDEYTRISRECGGCLEVRYVSEVIPGNPQSRITVDTRVVDVIAIQRGQTDPDRYVLVQGHYDSRATDVMNATADAPGANDDASGTSVAIEAARVLSKHRFDATIVYAALAGEEQGLNGAQILTRYAQATGWRIAGVLNNDIVGNTRGIGGQASNTVMRVFSPGIPVDAPDAELRRFLYSGGELDLPARQLARYVDRTADRYVPDLDVEVIYRLDRFGRGGDHTPFFQAGFPAVRLTEMYEDYTRQHQDLRTENGIVYGDVPDRVDYVYTGKITALNAASLASLAWAPAAPDSVTIRGALSANTTLRWKPVAAADLAGYRVYWRRATSPTWDYSRWVGNVAEATLEGIIIDNYFFGVAAVDGDGNESLVVFPAPGR